MEELSESDSDTLLEDAKLVELMITVNEAKIMKGPRHEPFISFVTVEMGENLLAVSDHCDLKEDNTFPYNLTFKLQAHVGDYFRIDEFICKPLILTVTESAGYSKKPKDTIALCICSVDLLPILLTPEIVQTRKYTLQFFEPPKKEPPIEPEIELRMHFSNSLMGQDLLKYCNIIQITMESCYSLPDELISTAKPDDIFIVGCSLPLLQESDEPIVFRNGTLVHGKPDSTEEKKWYTASPSSTGKALYIADSYIQLDHLEDDVGDFQDENDIAFREQTENTAKSRIVWNTEFRSLISPTANSKIIQNIRKYRYLPLEFVQLNYNAKKKLSFNAVAYVNLTHILFPGTNSIHGAYQLRCLSETDMKTKSNKGSLFIRGTQSRQGSTFLMSVLQKKTLCREEASERIKEGLGQLESPELFDGIISDAALAFEEKRTYITTKISLFHPLVEQRQPEELRLKVSELIPHRNLTGHPIESAQKAVDDFGIQVCNTAALLLEDYKTLLIKDAAGSQTKDRLTTQDYRKTKFMHELKKTGKYFACKEQLKYHIIRIVRDKYLRKSSFESSQEFEEFLSTLYVYLIEEMHKHLNKYFSVTDATHTPYSINGSEDLKMYAADAFAIGRYDLAEKYHLLRIQQFNIDPSCWVDYGIYCLGIGNQDKAAECFRHSLTINNDHFRGLLLYGMVCDICGRTDQTETFLLHAVNVFPNCALSRTIVGLYYHGIRDSIGAESFYKQAMHLLRSNPMYETPEAANSTPVKTSTDAITGLSSRLSSSLSSKLTVNILPDDRIFNDEPSIFLSCLPFLFNCNVAMYARRALAQDLAAFQCVPRGHYHFFLAKLKCQENDYTAAELAIKDALDNDNMNADVWSLSGHIYYALGNKTKAKQNFTRALSIQKPPVDLHIIYYKLGILALESRDYDKAKKNFLLTCKHSPSSLAWIGVGRACYWLEEFSEAEEAFSEANILDNTNPEVWGHLTLVALKTGRQNEVEQAYRFCCKCDLKDKKLLDEIHNLAEEVGMSLTPV